MSFGINSVSGIGYVTRVLRPEDTHAHARGIASGEIRTELNQMYC